MTRKLVSFATLFAVLIVSMAPLPGKVESPVMAGWRNEDVPGASRHNEDVTWLKSGRTFTPATRTLSVPPDATRQDFAEASELLFSDDFSTEKGWIDESNGHIYRDATNEWLNWSVTRPETRRYYVPISASPEFLQLDFRVRQTGAGGNGGTGFSLVESLEGLPGDYFHASGIQVHVTRDTLWGPRVLMGAKFANGDTVGLTTPGGIPYDHINVWLDVRLIIDGQVATLTVWDENHNELGQRVLELPQSHSGYHYFGIIFDAEGGWEWATGYLDDIELWGQPSLISPTRLDFGPTQDELDLSIQPESPTDTWELIEDIPWLELSDQRGTGPSIVTVSVDRSGLSTGATYYGDIYAVVGRTVMTLRVTMHVIWPGMLTGTTYDLDPVAYRVPCPRVLVSAGAGLSTVSDDDGEYTLPLMPGTYDISFWKLGYQTEQYKGMSITSDQSTELNVIMLSPDCWGTDQVCFNELINVVPYLGIPSEVAGALNNLCEADRRINENNDKLGALTMIVDALIDIAGVIADYPDLILDTFEGLVSCVESVAYDWLETLGGPEAARSFSRLLWWSILHSEPLVVLIEEHLPLNATTKTGISAAHSLDLHVYSGSQHLGMVNGEVEHSIPSSYLFRIGDRYQLAIIKDSTAQYQVQIKGKGTSEFDMILINSRSRDTGTLVSYKGLEVLEGSVTSVTLDQETDDYTLQIDRDGDGVVDEQGSPDDIEDLRIEHIYLPLVLESYGPNQAPHTPSDPSPSDQATDQPSMPALAWTGEDPDGDAVTYDVKLEPEDGTPDTLVCEDVTRPICNPGMLITGTHHYWQVVATDEHGATTTGPVWEFTTTTATCEEEIANGGFETTGDWEIPITAFRAAYSTAEAHTGSRSMRVGIVNAGENKYSYSSARQLISIPANADSATLRFRLYSLSGEASMSAMTIPEHPLASSVEEAALDGDAQYVLILDENDVWIDTVLWQRRDDRAWTYHQADLVNYAGQTIKLQYGVYNDGSGGVTGMYVDDVSLEVCTLPAPNQPPLTPSEPLPSDQATDQPTILALAWTGGDPDGDTVTYDVKLELEDDTPDPLVCEDVVSPYCEPGVLMTGTHYYWQVVATDEHGASTTGPVWEFTTTTATCVDTITNGDFEISSDWELPITAYRAAYSTAEAHTGSRSMRVGIVNASENKYSYSSARQLVTIPAEADSVTLRFWLLSLSGEAGTSVTMIPEHPLAPSVEEAALDDDAQYVLILDENNVWIDTLLWQRRDDRAWTYHEADLTDYAGQTIKLQFGVYNDGTSGVTGMYVDDVSLLLCSP